MAEWPPGDGEMAARIRAHDWSSTPLGPSAAWPQRLKLAVEVMLDTNSMSQVIWGPGLTYLYNDALSPLFAGRSVAALGRPFPEVWPEPELAEIARESLAGGTFGYIDRRFNFVAPFGKFAGWFTGAWIPLRSDDGSVAGFMAYGFDTTARVLAERKIADHDARQAFILELSDAVGATTDASEIQAIAARMLGERLGAASVYFAQVFPTSDGNEYSAPSSVYVAPGLHSVAAPQPFSRFPGLVAALCEGRPVAVDSVADDARLTAADREHFLELGVSAFARTPLIKKGRLRAILAVNGAGPRKWTDLDVALMVEVAERTWDAVERARAETAQRAVEARLNRDVDLFRQLHDLSASSEGDTRDRFFGRIVDAALAIMGADFASLQVLDAEGGNMDLVASRNFHPLSAAFWKSVAVVGGAACVNGDRIVVPNVEAGGVQSGGDLAHFRLCGIAALQSTPLTSREGRVIGILSTHWRLPHAPDAEDLRVFDILARQAADFVERERAQAELRASEARFRGVFEHVPTAISLSDLEGNVKYSNRAFQTLVGCDEADLRAAPFQNFIHPDDVEANMNQVERLRAGEIKSFEIENRFVRKDGQPVWVRKFVSFVPDGDGKPKFFIALATDVTEQRRAAKASDQAQRLESLGRLAGGIAHDFNNLLTAISANLELAESGVADDFARDALKHALDAVGRGASLNRRLLSFARRRVAAPEATDLNERVRDTAELLKRTLGEQVEIETRLAADLWLTRIDPGEVDGALLNLALNARDAMEGGGLLTIETANVFLGEDGANRAGVTPGQYVALTLTDNGCGMTPDVLSRALDPFFTTKETGKGTGLGLSSVYGFAKRSGGAVEITSEVGKGAAVRIVLPRAAKSPGRAAEGAQKEETPAGDGETVLVVEDDDQVRRATLSRLEVLGYSVLEAPDAPRAIEILKRETGIDLVFSDVVMPGGMSGYDLAAWVKAERPGIKVLLASGYDSPFPEARRDAAAVVLAKPYTRVQLAHALKERLTAD